MYFNKNVLKNVQNVALELMLRCASGGDGRRPPCARCGFATTDRAHTSHLLALKKQLFQAMLFSM